MKVISVGGCVLIIGVAGLGLGFSLFIGGATRAAEAPVWTETCTIHRLRAEAEILCNSYSAPVAVDQKVLASMRPALQTCHGYKTYWGGIDVACEEITASEE